MRSIINRRHSFLRDQCTRGQLRNPDEVFASILLSIWFELMDSGKDCWKDHLHGLQKIMQTFNFPRGLAASISQFSECFDINYAMYAFLGPNYLSLESANLLLQIWDHWPDIRQNQTALPTYFHHNTRYRCLESSESQTWAGCPAELLFAPSLINAASSNLEQTPDLVYHICSLLRKFSPIQWATNGSKADNAMPRYH